MARRGGGENATGEVIYRDKIDGAVSEGEGGKGRKAWGTGGIAAKRTRLLHTHE